MFRLLTKSVIFLSTLFTCVSSAYAFTISGMGGTSFLGGNATNVYQYSSPSALLGGEATFNFLNLLEIGAFFDYNILSIPNGTTGPLNFYGAVGRIKPISYLPWALDAKLGLTTQNACNPSSNCPPNGSNVAVGFGFGISYEIPVLFGLSIKPRLGYRLLPYNVVNVETYYVNSLDMNVLLSFSL